MQICGFQPFTMTEVLETVTQAKKRNIPWPDGLEI